MDDQQDAYRLYDNSSGEEDGQPEQNALIIDDEEAAAQREAEEIRQAYLARREGAQNRAPNRVHNRARDLARGFIGIPDDNLPLEDPLVECKFLDGFKLNYTDLWRQYAKYDLFPFFHSTSRLSRRYI